MRTDHRQEPLAEVLGVHRTYMGGVERGERNRTLQRVERIARTIWVEAAEWESNRLLPSTYPVVRPLLTPGRSQFGHKQPVRERYGS